MNNQWEAYIKVKNTINKDLFSIISAQTKKAIPFGLSLKIIRICRDPEKKRPKAQRNEEKQLMDRGYSNHLLDSAIEKAR